MEIISIYPDKKLKKKLTEMAKEEQRSLNNFILFILKNYVKNKKK